MKTYAAYGIQDFVICLGYKGYAIKEYFANYVLHMSDATIDLEHNKVELHDSRAENWRVTLVDTGEETMTGGRIKRIQPHVDGESFLLTYGDGVADIDIVTGRDHMGDVMELLGKWTRLRSRLHLQGTGPGRGYRLGAGPCPVRHGGSPSLRRVVSTPLLARFGTGVQEITNESGVMASGDFGARARMTVWG